MSDKNLDNLPASQQSSGARDEQSRALYYVENLHYHANDLTELRRIAETNPELASEIVQSNLATNRLVDGSYRLGLILASVLAFILAAGVVTIALVLGVWQTIVFIAAMLGIGHLLRVVLTGEWSDTSWFARFIGAKKDDKPSDGE
ncbi:hypothetical protein [Paracoccus marcusii]|uniref:hypothetical protein n=1 Tax=Paracoccus marcusii TaxID=59779 RepID=UPI002491B534|nr:hypothetical protein [Paracoccus marcusii]